MREALLIFRKDVRHLWPRTIPLLAVTALMGWMERHLFGRNPIFEVLRGAWLLSAAFLVASVIQEEQLPGHQQYWLTRPYHRSCLFLSKALFLAVFAWLPTLAIQAISLEANGVAWWRHIPLLLVTTLSFACWACAIVAALASVTGDLVQFLWGFLPSFGIVILGVVLSNRSDHTSDWGSLEWIRDSEFSVILLFAALAVLFLQYSRRRTALSRCLLGGFILIASAVLFLGSWHNSWAIESKLSAQRIDSSTAQLAFDPGGRTLPGFGGASYAPGGGQAGINLPIRMTAIRSGTAIVSERIAVRIEAPDGRSWSSTWTEAGGVYRTTPLEDSHLIPVDGQYLEYVNVDDVFYQSVKDMPVHVHTTVALTLLGERQTAPLATRDRNEYFSSEGKCNVGAGPFGKLEIHCAWLGHAPERSYVTAVSAQNGQTFTSLMCCGSEGPFPMNGSVWVRGGTLFTPPPATHEMDLETWQAVARFDRDLDLPQIRLADYAVRRITDMP